MFESSKTFNPGSAASFITMLIIGMVLIGSVMIPFILDTSVETVESDNGIGAGVPLAKSTDNITTALYILQLESDGIVISGAYSDRISYDNQIVILSDVMAVYVYNHKLYIYDSDTIQEITDSYRVTIVGGKINNMDYEWIYRPLNNGEYKSYIPPIKYENGEVAALGVYQSNIVISNDTTVVADNIESEVTVDIERSTNGIDQVYYTWDTITIPVLSIINPENAGEITIEKDGPWQLIKVLPIILLVGIIYMIVKPSLKGRINRDSTDYDNY